MTDRTGKLPTEPDLNAAPADAVGERNDSGFVFVESAQTQDQPLTSELFSWQGRYARDRFWVVYISSVVAASLASLLMFSPVLVTVYLLGLSWVFFGSIVKRFHDRDKSAWWLLIGFVPFLGTIWIFVECGLLEGSKGVNSYGANALGLKGALKNGVFRA